MNKTAGSFMVQLDGNVELYWAAPVADVVAQRDGIDVMVWGPAKELVEQDDRPWLYVTIGVNQLLVPMSRVTAIKVGSTPASGGVKA